MATCLADQVEAATGRHPHGAMTKYPALLFQLWCRADYAPIPQGE